MNEKKVEKKKVHWHFYNWTFFGWLETAIKLIAIFTGIWAFLVSRHSHTWSLPTGIQLIQWIILGLLSLGIFLAIFNRWQNREMIAMVFVLINNLGHWGMFLALGKNVGWILLPYFGFFMMLGDLTKILFLYRTKYTERSLPVSLFIYGTLVFVIGYGLIVLLSFFY